MLTTTLTGEPGTLRRFAEAAVAGTQLNITELRHRCAVVPCKCNDPTCGSLPRMQCSVFQLACHLAKGMLAAAARQPHGLACPALNQRRDLLHVHLPACHAGTLRGGRATSCGAWACISLPTCQTSWRAWTRRASPRATSPPSRLPRRAQYQGSEPSFSFPTRTDTKAAGV